MSHIYLETERLSIRQWELEDAEQLCKIMSDSRVHIFTGDKPWSYDRTLRYIEFMLEKDFITLEVFHGACVLKSNQVLVGFTGLNPYLPRQPEIEWQLGVPYWGNGFATEIGKAVITKAFETTAIERIYGMANPQNTGSIRVMEKIGMKSLGLRDFRGHQDLFFVIERGETLLRKPDDS